MTSGLLPLAHFHSGKVRETYFLPDEKLLFQVPSDRLSTHNVTHLTPIPGKGELLTALSIFWALEVLSNTRTHLVWYGKSIYDVLPKQEYPSDLHLRGLAVLRRKPNPIEYVWRRYLTGSLAELYARVQKGEAQDPYGLNLPPGLKRMHRFDRPLFTPTDKSATDDPQPADLVSATYPGATMTSEKVFLEGEEYLASRGIVLLDMKCEMDGAMLVDEWLTGDCSRMAWETDVADALAAGTDPRWLDKEVARQIATQKWGGGPRVPLTFTDIEVRRILDRYHEAFEGITGMSLSTFQSTYLT